ncbi:hypothetical protein [Streptomyces sp. NPDC051567]
MSRTHAVRERREATSGLCGAAGGTGPAAGAEAMAPGTRRVALHGHG